jgi:3-hydroxyacyl-CoA dehydrogenase
MKLVEVVPGLRTKPEVVERLLRAARLMTREPVVCIDSPGFIVNHIGRAYVPEAGRIVSEGIATHDEVDRVMTATVGMLMGPFQLLDLVGADVAVMEALRAIYQEPMAAPRCCGHGSTARSGRKRAAAGTPTRAASASIRHPRRRPPPGRDRSGCCRARTIRSCSGR